jgi:hypothetical protein
MFYQVLYHLDFFQEFYFIHTTRYKWLKLKMILYYDLSYFNFIFNYLYSYHISKWTFLLNKKIDKYICFSIEMNTNVGCKKQKWYSFLLYI